jgi:hypothetical protein
MFITTVRGQAVVITWLDWGLTLHFDDVGTAWVLGGRVFSRTRFRALA